MNYYIGQIIKEEEYTPDLANWLNKNQCYWDGEKIVKSKIDIKNILHTLRKRRQYECFDIINRGALWYNKLTEEQKQELNIWYKDWLDITENIDANTNIEEIIPKTPSWINNNN